MKCKFLAPNSDFFLKFYFLLALVGLLCCTGILQLQPAGATLHLWCPGVLSAVASLAAEHSSRALGLLRHVGSVIAAPRLNSCGARA